MHNGQPVLQQLPDHFTAQNGLHRYSSNGDHAEPAQPTTLVFEPNQNRQRQRKNAQPARNYAVGMLEERAPGKLPQRGKPGSNRLWPARSVEVGSIAMDTS